ncbi:hypothetical protein A2704_05670 [Candidatus Kaiserbacteria bacterium RIFCSPHIGHO2_01_FULL_54_36b]|uniref:Uncharacterized protein n=1 Tax=Candidatus Kaiserbacteria bacterium RIFCSPHIGHO2_01_FULL_54_36b TaxID=1798483 RepID=A0A1F6CMF2_9BACT|nr:MAG: hypothetical protein A2704_05670 [Candidatus Kaiserbacteria bacterium RIFCSPHIGHO2_01_FULL_54_36b]
MPKRPYRPVVRDEYTEKQRLYGLLQAYDALREILYVYCQDVLHPRKDLNIIYIREVVPAIKNLAGGLKIKLPSYYLPFGDLNTAQSDFHRQGLTTNDVIMRVNEVYGKIKNEVERIDATFSTPMPEIEKMVEKVWKTIHADQIKEKAFYTNNVAKVFKKDGWWHISTKNLPESRLFKAGTLYGETMGFLGREWGYAYSQEVVIEQVTKGMDNNETPTGLQIKKAEKEFNRRLKAIKYPPVQLITNGTTWQLVFRYTHQ